MPLRVIHIVAPSFGYTFSGTTKHILRLISDWNEPDIDLTLWGSDYLQHKDSDNEFLWSSNTRNTWSIRLRWSIRLFWMLIRCRRNYDLVHAHTLWLGGLLTPLLASILGKKAIYHMTLLGGDTPGAVAALPLGWLKLKLFKLYHGMIGLTPALIEDCYQHKFSSEFMVLPGYLLFDAPPSNNASVQRKHTRQQWGIPEQSQVLLFVGSIVPRKGIDVLIDLFIQLASQRPDLWLVLVGARKRAESFRLKEEYVAVQQEKLELAGLSERVVWTGLIRDEATLIDLYRASDLFVFPTRAEGQGYVILEAMGCGLPVVCSFLPGVTDVMVTHGETGYLIKVDDLNGFVAATTKLLEEPALCLTMGTAGRKRATTNFAFESYCHQLARFYHIVADD